MEPVDFALFAPRMGTAKILKGIDKVFLYLDEVEEFEKEHSVELLKLS